MQLERVRPSVLRLTLHAYELAALIAAARLVAQKGEEELPEEAAQQLRQAVSFDNVWCVPEQFLLGVVAIVVRVPRN